MEFISSFHPTECQAAEGIDLINAQVIISNCIFNVVLLPNEIMMHCSNSSV